MKSRSRMPGHGDRFDGLAARCRALIEHHDERIEKVNRIVAEGGTWSTYSVANELFGELRDFHVILGCAEAQSHLDFLVSAGRLIREGDQYHVSDFTAGRGDGVTPG